jgi:hypothetical protein
LFVLFVFSALLFFTYFDKFLLNFYDSFLHLSKSYLAIDYVEDYIDFLIDYIYLSIFPPFFIVSCIFSTLSLFWLPNFYPEPEIIGCKKGTAFLEESTKVSHVFVQSSGELKPFFPATNLGIIPNPCFIN